MAFCKTTLSAAAIFNVAASNHAQLGAGQLAYCAELAHANAQHNVTQIAATQCAMSGHMRIVSVNVAVNVTVTVMSLSMLVPASANTDDSSRNDLFAISV